MVMRSCRAASRARRLLAPLVVDSFNSNESAQNIFPVAKMSPKA